MIIPNELIPVFKNKDFILAGSRALKAQNMLGREETHDYDVILDYKYFDLVKDKYTENTMYRRDFPIIICEEKGLKTDIFFRKDYDFLLYFEKENIKILWWQEVLKEKLILIDSYKNEPEKKQKHINDVNFILSKIV